MRANFPKLAGLFSTMVFVAAAAFAQNSGRLSGKVTDADGKPLAGVIVVVTNQTSTNVSFKRTGSDGGYSFHLRGGAYRVSVRAPFEARFDRGKLSDYGNFASLICDEKKHCSTLENVIVDGGERKVDFVAVEPGKEPADAKTATKAATVEKREFLDRWRYQFPEYDRYGDKGAQGRDIPFRRGNKWYNPYDRNVLKGDYPVIGNDYFMILSGVSTTGVEIRRTPSGNNVSSHDPGTNYFFGRPESLSVGGIL